jgi:hypothetical protein
MTDLLPSEGRVKPPKVRAPPDLRGAWLSRAIAKIVPKPGLGVGHCGRPKRRRSLGRRPLPRLTLLAGRRTRSSGLIRPPKLRRCESDSSGDGAWRRPGKGDAGLRPLHRGEQAEALRPLARSCPLYGRARMTQDGRFRLSRAARFWVLVRPRGSLSTHGTPARRAGNETPTGGGFPGRKRRTAGSFSAGTSSPQDDKPSPLWPKRAAAVAAPLSV